MDKPQRPPMKLTKAGLIKIPIYREQFMAWISFADAETRRADEAEARIRDNAGKWDALKEAKNRALEAMADARQQASEAAARKIEEWHHENCGSDTHEDCAGVSLADLVRQP